MSQLDLFKRLIKSFLVSGGSTIMSVKLIKESKMTVRDAMRKYGRSDYNTRVYVKDLDDEEYRGLYRYYDSEVLNIYDHNGDMVCVVKEAK